MTDTDHSALAGTWTFDPDHCRIGFSTRHAMISKVRGAFNQISGRAVFDPENADANHVELFVEMASIDTRSKGRDDHLRSADFFDVENHPQMVFRSTRVEEVGDNGYIITGDLTIRGITRSLSIPMALTGVDTDPFGNRRAGFEGTRRIDRRDWGVSWNTPLDSGGLLVSDKISLEFELSLIKESDDTTTGLLEDPAAQHGEDAPQHEDAQQGGEHEDHGGEHHEHHHEGDHHEHHGWDHHQG